MKICYLNHDLKPNTGAGRFGLSLLKEMELAWPGLEMAVVTSEPSGDSREVFSIKPGKIGLIFSVFKIRRVFRDCGIIHALDGWPYGFAAALASLGLKKKLVITAIGSGAVAPLYDFFKRSLVVWAYHRANAVTAISRNTRREILKVVPDLAIRVINHGVDFEKFQRPVPVPLADSLRPYILSVGVLKPRKGYEHSIKAFAEMAADFPGLNYVIFGSDYAPGQKEYRRLRNIAEKLGVGSRVIFLTYDEKRGLAGRRLTDEELAYLFRQAELFTLLPQDVNKDLEGFGLVFLEAAASGLAVVATKETSAEDAVLDGRNGILAPPGDYLAAAAAIKKILSDPALKADFSRASVEFAKKMSWQKTAGEYAAVYREL